MNEVHVANDSGGRIDTKWLRERLMEVARRLRLRDPAVNVIVVNDRAMSKLHEQYRGVKGTTDVLTFDLSPPLAASRRNKSRLDAEIYICADEARRRSADLDHELKHELLLYALHGLLHLLGYDDHNPADFQRMHAKEDELLGAIGVGPLFARAAGGRP